MKTMIGIIQRILDANTLGWTVTFFTAQMGLPNLENAAFQAFSQENIMKIAVMTSAITGAIYGVYRVGDITLKGINKLLNKYRDVKRRKRSKRSK